MPYPDAFIAGLFPEGRAILRYGARALGARPFSSRPSLVASGAQVLHGGIAYDAGISTPASITTELGDPLSASEWLRYPHTRILSTTDAGGTAGQFTLPTAWVQLYPRSGFVVDWTTSGAFLGAASRGGGFLAADFAGDGTFRPERAEAGSGWVKRQGISEALQWYGGVPDVVEACTGSAPSDDDRRYRHILAATAGSLIGYALLIDLADPLDPRVADQRYFPWVSIDTPRGVEKNRSPTATSGGMQQVLRDYGLSGSLYVPRIAALAD